MPALAPIAACGTLTLAPEPCPPVRPPDPPALTLEGRAAAQAFQTAWRARPRDGLPPFSAPAHWTARTLPHRGGITPSGYWVQFQGYTYLSYQGEIGNISGVGPVPVACAAGAIVRSADGVTWTTVFVGDAGAVADLRMPGLLWVRGDTLYCVMGEGSRSWVLPWAYVGPGEMAIWKTTDGLTWAKHRVLASWTAHGTGANAGGTASRLEFHTQTQWRAQGSGPAGETADWLVASYMVLANEPGAEFFQREAPQLRSLDAGGTWTQIRDMMAQWANGPGPIIAVPRPGVAVDRWVMWGYQRSDDLGATWQNVAGIAADTAMHLPSGGGLSTQGGGITGGPTLQVSCDYFQSNTGPAAAPSGNANTGIEMLGFAAAGGEELLAITRQGLVAGETAGDAVWHTTNGGEAWTYRGTVPVATTGLRHALARVPTGRVLLYQLGGGGGAPPELWTCDDAPTGIATPRTICPFTVPTLAPLAGCASLTFATEPCAGLVLPAPLETCTAPLGAFVLGETCLGAPAGVPVAARRRRR